MFEPLPKFVQDWLWKNAWRFPNVVGFSGDILPRFRHRAWEPARPVVRFYVKEKVDLDALRPLDIIPEELKIRRLLKKFRLETDVFKIGLPEKFVDKTKNFRPVELGVSVGNQAITAGSLGMLYERTITEITNITRIPISTMPAEFSLNARIFSYYQHADFKTTKDIVAGSNAHVISPNAGWSVEDVIKSGQTKILQRGSYHGGKVPTDVVGEYLWHQQLFPLNIPSDCNVAGGVVNSLNRLSQLLRRKSRFRTYVPHAGIGINSIDFGLYKPSVEHILKIADDSIDTTKKFTAHLYAGSDTSGVLCKISEILKARPDIRPLNNNWGDCKVGDIIKGCSFWCNYATEVIDISGAITVNYGDFMALMSNAIVTKNDGTIKGGWSGSGWWIEN